MHTDIYLAKNRGFHKLGMMLLLLFLIANTFCSAAVVQLQDAQALVSQSGQSERYPVQLPYKWDTLNASKQGTAEFELAFDLAQTHDEAYAVLMARSGNAYEVWLNGRLLARSGELANFNSSDYAKTPQMFTVPSGLLGNENLFRIHIRADAGRRAGLSPVLIGPEREVRPLYEVAHTQQVTSAIAVALLCALTALLSGTLWLTQPKTSPLAALEAKHLGYGWATLSLLAWGIRVLSEAIEMPLMPWPWWGFGVAAADGCNAACLVIFCQRLLGRDFPQNGAPSILAVCAVVALEAGGAALAYFLKLPNVWLVCIAVVKLGFLLYAVYFIGAAWRTPSRAAKLFSVAMGASLFLVVAGRIYSHILGELYGNAALTRYASLVFCAALAATVVHRIRTMRLQVGALALSLQSQIALKEQQLADSYVQIELLARVQARNSERSRILRDIHDGVGSQLAAAIGQLQMPSSAHQTGEKDRTAALLPVLNESLDHLKLSVDALDLPDGDLGALLAALRYRLEPRLRLTGLTLVWNVDLLPNVPSLNRPAMQQLQFVVYEWLSNTMQHANASQVMVHAHCQKPLDADAMSAQLLVLTLSDNGKGLPADLDWNSALRAGLGLRGLGARLQALGVSWQICATGNTLEHGCSFRGAAVQLVWIL